MGRSDLGGRLGDVEGRLGRLLPGAQHADGEIDVAFALFRGGQAALFTALLLCVPPPLDRGQGLRDRSEPVAVCRSDVTDLGVPRRIATGHHPDGLPPLVGPVDQLAAPGEGAAAGLGVVQGVVAVLAHVLETIADRESARHHVGRLEHVERRRVQRCTRLGRHRRSAAVSGGADLVQREVPVGEVAGDACSVGHGGEESAGDLELGLSGPLGRVGLLHAALATGSCCSLVRPRGVRLQEVDRVPAGFDRTLAGARRGAVLLQPVVGRVGHLLQRVLLVVPRGGVLGLFEPLVDRRQALATASSSDRGVLLEARHGETRRQPVRFAVGLLASNDRPARVGGGGPVNSAGRQSCRRDRRRRRQRPLHQGCGALRFAPGRTGAGADAHRRRSRTGSSDRGAKRRGRARRVGDPSRRRRRDRLRTVGHLRTVTVSEIRRREGRRVSQPRASAAMSG